MRAKISNHYSKLRLVILCGLALTIIILNFARPFSLAYRGTAQIVASESRLHTLSTRLEKSNVGSAIQVMPSDSLLFELPFQSATSASIPNLQVRAVEVRSATSLTETTLLDSLHRLSAKEEVNAAMVSKEARMNRWMITILKHQIERIDWKDDSSTTEQLSENTAPTPAETDSPFRLVSTTSNNGTSDILETLRQQLIQREFADQNYSRELEQLNDASYGNITLATPWKVQPYVTRIRVGSFSLCIVLSTIIGVLLIYRKEVVSVYQQHNSHSSAKRVLQRLNIELIGEIGRPSRATLVEDSDASLHQEAQVSFWIHRISEGIILASASSCLLRYALDSSWRLALHEAPLAALSSSFLGL